MAEHLALQTNVAVKLIDPELAKKDSARERFRREATAAAQLRSAHVVQILDHGIDGTQPFIVMELLDGEDLFERLAHRGRLPLRETSRIVTQVGRALSRAHQAGIVHRDLKPENVFLVPNEDDEIVKVLDFGVAKVTAPDDPGGRRATGVGTLIGTPHYMSPEQVKGVSDVDHRADLWALGIIAYQCVTGELPFDSPGVGDLLVKISVAEIPVPSKVLPSVPAGFDAWFARACERDPNKRFQSARELALALATVVAGVAEVPRATTVRPPSKISLRPAPPSKSAPLSDQVPPAPRAARLQLAAEEPVEAVEEVEEADAPEEPGREMFDSTEIDFDFDDEPEPNLRFSHVEFPLLIRAGSPAAAAQKAAAASASPSAPPSAPSSGRAIPPPPRSGAGAADDKRTSGPPAAPSGRGTPPPRVAPVIDVLSAPRAAAAESAPAPAPAQRPAPSPPRPQPAAPAPKPQAERPPTTVTGLARPRSINEDPPPEFDGSKRKRMVRLLVAALLIGALGVTVSVVRSQLGLMGGGTTASPAETTTTPAVETPPPPPTVEPPRMTTPATTAVDPGKVSHPIKSTPSAATPTKGRPGKKKVPEGVIEISDGPEE